MAELLLVSLRAERDVRLAVLFGSTATGKDRTDSDVDLLVVLRHTEARAQVRLKLRLRSKLGTSVDLVTLEQAEAMPTLLSDVLREGRVLIDRDELWAALLQRQGEIEVAARREDETIIARAHATIAAARERLSTADVGPTSIAQWVSGGAGPA